MQSNTLAAHEDAKTPMPIVDQRALLERGAAGLSEMIMVIALILSILAGILFLYNRVTFNNDISTTSSQVSTLQTEIRTLFQGQALFSASPAAADQLNPILVQAGSYPENILVDQAAATFQHAFNGAIDVEGQGTEFRIYLDDLSNTACTRLAPVSRSGTAPVGVGIVDVAIGDATSQNSVWVAGEGVTSATAAAECDNTSNTIVYTYAR